MNVVPVLWPTVLRKRRPAFLIKDDFRDVRAAGAVNATPATPGPGTRGVTDTGGTLLSVSGGQAVIAPGGVWTNPLFWHTLQITRAPGVTAIFQIQRALSGEAAFGFAGTATGAIYNSEATVHLNGANIYNMPAAADCLIGTLTTAATFFAIVLKSTGAYYYSKLSGGFWKFLYSQNTRNDASVFIGASCCTTSTLNILMMRLATEKWLPPVLVYDTFTRSNGALGSSEVAGPDGQVVPARTWVNAVGTWAIATNVAAATVLSGGIAIATVDANTRSVAHGAALTRSAGNVGIVVSYVDAQNYIYAYHDGTNAHLNKVVATVDTPLINAAATYAAGARLVCFVDGTSVKILYNDAQIGTVQTVSDAGLLSGTKVGLFTSNTGNTMDNVQTMPLGNAGENSGLNKFIR